ATREMAVYFSIRKSYTLLAIDGEVFVMPRLTAVVPVSDEGRGTLFRRERGRWRVAVIEIKVAS
ncbi:MAG TPA: hypothetical protein VK491_04705, partial [Gemmatimonadaceae bacterium]|nr:hypothetical protein [Gemmatimonadaceae bacterium]